MSDPNFVTCLCQHCSGHIKFDANQLKKNEVRQVECPHCHLETVLYIPQPYQKISKQPSTDKKANPPELVLFGGIRLLILLGAILVSIALVIVGFLALQTFLPEKPEPIHSVSYEEVAPIKEIPSQNQEPIITSGPRIASAGMFPQPVIDFLIKHQGFSLKEWLDSIEPENRKPFLENLSQIVENADFKKLNVSESEQVVSDYSKRWIAINEKEPDPSVAKEKLFRLASYTSTAFALLIILTILTLILVLLAIERNTRNLTFLK